MIDIVIHGPMGSGKTTLANKLREALPNEEFRIFTSQRELGATDLRRLEEEFPLPKKQTLFRK